MLTLKTSVAAAILVGAIGATAAATYTVTRMSVDVTCPVAATDNTEAAQDEALKKFGNGRQLPMNQGKGY
jgi:hypothetical protein